MVLTIAFNSNLTASSVLDDVGFASSYGSLAYNVLSSARPGYPILLCCCRRTTCWLQSVQMPHQNRGDLRLHFRDSKLVEDENKTKLMCYYTTLSFRVHESSNRISDSSCLTRSVGNFQRARTVLAFSSTARTRPLAYAVLSVLRYQVSKSNKTFCNSTIGKDGVEVASENEENAATSMVEGKRIEEVAIDSIAERFNRLEELENTENLKDTVEGEYNLFRDKEFLRKAALAEDADSAMAIISQSMNSGGILSNDDCCQLIQAALAVNNANLAFSILNAMRSTHIYRRVGNSDEDSLQVDWRWPQPSVKTYIALVRGLAASLRVTDAIRIIGDVKRRGIPVGEEVPFGKVVKCPTCETALAVVQPHQGIQLVPCSKCRYQYELFSGDVINSESEAVSMNISAFQRGLRSLQVSKKPLPSAVHSIVVRCPNGIARTHRFATASADVPAQEGERITVVTAAPINSSIGLGPFKVSARAPGWRPSEPMSVTNHATSCVYPLLRAPPKSGSGAALDISVLFPAIFLLAGSDAATGLIDPTLPRTIAIAATSAAVLGTAANTFVLPQINQIPQRTADAMALRQQLLAQYEVLQERLQELTQGAAEEVRILARLCQLQNKMEAVREPGYSARMERLCKARVGLDERLSSRLELIDSYAKVSSMIEIEVEMDLDVFAAEAGGAVESIASQIERLEEVENLQKQWRLQAEANDELERLLQSSPAISDTM